jgi:hypothetical protein
MESRLAGTCGFLASPRPPGVETETERRRPCRPERQGQGHPPLMQEPTGCFSRTQQRCTQESPQKKTLSCCIAGDRPAWIGPSVSGFRVVLHKRERLTTGRRQGPGSTTERASGHMVAVQQIQQYVFCRFPGPPCSGRSVRLNLHLALLQNDNHQSFGLFDTGKLSIIGDKSARDVGCVVPHSG